MPNHDPAASPTRALVRAPDRTPVPVLPSRAARHAAPAAPGTGSGGRGRASASPSRRRPVVVAVALVTLVGGLTGGALALDRGPVAPPPAAEAAVGRAEAPAAAVASRGRSRLPSQRGRPAPRRAKGMTKAPATTTTKPPTSTTTSGGSAGSDRTAPPPADGFPGPGNTGVPAGVSLTASGSLTVSRAGAVVDRLDVKGCLTIAASNVTVRRSRIRCSGDFPVKVTNGARNAVIEDVEIDGLGSPAATAVGGSNYTLRRADVHDVGDGPRVSDNTVVEDSWIHDLAVGGGSHNDGIQATEGSNIRILHNRIEHPNEQTSCVLIGADLGNISDVLVQGNLLNGGNYAVYAGADPGFRAENVRIVGNRFGRDSVYGTHRIDANITFTGNVWQDSGARIGR